MRFLAPLLVLALPSLALAQPAPVTSQSGKVILTVSVDWEGRDLSERNLIAFEKFRKDNPKVPLTHFLNGAYYTKDGAEPEAVTAKIKRCLRPGDETGLHIHCWKSLVTAAGVTFREKPTFWSDESPLHPAEFGDIGHEVEIPAYDVTEITKIVREGRRRLREAGFAVSSSFRAGGWIADAKVLEAIRRCGFYTDSSEVDGTWHTRLQGYRIRERIFEIWEGSTPKTQPHTISTPVGPVLEMPDTGALADYVTAEQMKAHLREARARAAASPGKPVFVHLGFHTETAADYSPRVTEALREVAGDPVFEVATLQVAANRARKLLKIGPTNRPTLGIIGGIHFPQ